MRAAPRRGRDRLSPEEARGGTIPHGHSNERLGRVVGAVRARLGRDAADAVRPAA